jgi:hypothetical protein
VSDLANDPQERERNALQLSIPIPREVLVIPITLQVILRMAQTMAEWIVEWPSLSPVGVVASPMKPLLSLLILGVQ